VVLDDVGVAVVLLDDSSASAVSTRGLYPTSQIQSVTLLLPASETVFAGHSMQVDEAFAPVTIEYLPASHDTQAAVPLTSLYVPGTQALQMPEKFVGAGAQDVTKVPFILGGLSFPSILLKLMLVELLPLKFTCTEGG